GIDGSNNTEGDPVPSPTNQADQFRTLTFNPTPGAPAQVSAFVVQKGPKEVVGRSFIRYVDVMLDQRQTTADIVNSLKDADPTNDRIKIKRYDINGNPLTGAKAFQPITAAQINVLDSVIALDFGTKGITGSATSNAGDGFYEVQLDLDGNGSLETSRSFFRLLGDTNGDRIVDDFDLNAIAVDAALFLKGVNISTDVNGDGKVDAVDITLATNQKKANRKLSTSRPVD